MVHLFVLADMSRNKNNKFLYNERCMEKGAETLCSLQLKYHIESMRERKSRGVHLPEVYIIQMCWAKNSNVTMYLDCWLSFSFYKRILILYFVPGHFYMMADRLVVWAKLGIKNKKIVPKEMVKAMKGIEGIHA